MGDIGIEKLLLIMIVVLLLFGAKKIPEIGQSLGKGLREFKRSMSDINKEIMPPQESFRYAPPSSTASRSSSAPIDPPSRDVPPPTEPKARPPEPRRLI